MTSGEQEDGGASEGGGNALDQHYEMMAHYGRMWSREQHTRWQKQRQAMQLDGLKTTVEPYCMNGTCGGVVSGWGLWCSKCQGRMSKP